MAKFKFSDSDVFPNGANLYQMTTDVTQYRAINGGSQTPYKITEHTPVRLTSTYAFKGGDGIKHKSQFVWTGTNLKFDSHNMPVSGTVSTVQWVVDGKAAYTASDVDISVAKLVAAYNAGGNNFSVFDGSIWKGDDTFTGTSKNDYMTPSYNKLGRFGFDTVDGGAGVDSIDFVFEKGSLKVTLAGSSDATVYLDGKAREVLKNIENVAGGSGDDKLTGDGKANALTGYEGDDTLVGGGGDDTLTGSEGSDKLTGNGGSDHFYFATQGNDDVTRITDFTSGEDLIELSANNMGHNSFESLGIKVDKTELIVVTKGHAAKQANDHLIYNSKDGSLWYDEDGNGDFDAVELAALTNVPTSLTYKDFSIVDVV